jgi:hypothetical protein
MNTFLLYVLLLINANPTYKELVLSFRYEQANAIEKLCKKTPDFFFYKAISQFKTKDYKGASRSIDQLTMMNPAERYYEVGMRLKDEIDREKNKMDDIASDMTLSKERIESGQINKKTIEIQKEIIRKLDQEIKELEDKMKSAENQAGGGHRVTPIPMEDTKIIQAESGSGDINKKKLITSTDNWGSLPAKEKIKAMETLNKQLAPHIREATEGFSKKLNNPK